MPYHCYYSSSGNSVSSFYIDFTVNFNWIPSQIYNTANSQSDVNNLLCNLQSVMDSRVPAAAGYTNNNGATLTNVAGIAITGAPISNALTT